jgi:putative transposase
VTSSGWKSSNPRHLHTYRRQLTNIGDVGMHELKRQLEYKVKWTGRELVQVDRWASTSKTCSECGSVQETMPLKIREWTCPECHAAHDRDINAAKNILALATLGRRESDARGGVHSLEVVA